MKRKGFTLIELLAVIIILGILMLIAIPSVTSYINNSRKNTYIETIHEIIKGTVVKVNSGDLDMYDTDTTYYVPASAIKLEGGDAKSPYGKLNDAYVVVTYDGDSYDYYFVGKDEKDMGISEITKGENINKDSIQSDVGAINTNVGIEGKNNVVVFTEDLEKGPSQPANTHVSGSGKTSVGMPTVQCNGNECTCRRATYLHTEVCSYYGLCNSFVDYAPVGSYISYGNMGNGDDLNVGDAFDCDVNGDGVFNPTNERFYYITTEDEHAVLLYYSNTYNGVPTDMGHVPYYVPTKISDDDDDCGYVDENDDVHYYWEMHTTITYDGPKGAIGLNATNNPEYGPPLPTIYQWSNVRLKSQTRAIVGANGETSIDGHDLPTKFSYEDSAARLLTYQEVVEACNIDSSGVIRPNCNFLLENTDYSSWEDKWQYTYCGQSISSNGGYWLETPAPARDQIFAGLYNGYAYNIDSAGYVQSDYYENFGIRPVIEVPLLKIDKNH